MPDQIFKSHTSWKLHTEGKFIDRVKASELEYTTVFVNNSHKKVYSRREPVINISSETFFQQEKTAIEVEHEKLY